jgi:hypothetical protein
MEEVQYPPTRCHFRQRFKEIRIKDLRPMAAIEAFNVRVLIGSARLDMAHSEAPLGAPVAKDLRDQLGPVIDPDERVWPE